MSLKSDHRDLNLAKDAAAAEPGLDPNRPTPSKLYKYRPLTDATREWLRTILVENQVFFSSRLDFNDPFDCRVPSFRNVNRKDMLEFLLKRAPVKNYNRPMRRKIAREIDFDKLRGDLQRDVDKAGILSLSERRDNLLMWGHYASSHTGICLEFDVSIPGTFFGHALPVRYPDSRPMFDPKGTEEKNVEMALLTKSNDWTYECEWRIIDQHSGKGNRPFRAELLTGIIFGCRILSDDRKLIRGWISEKGRKVHFYKAVENERAWKLDIVPG